MAKKTTSVKKRMTKSEIFSEISEATELTKRDIAGVFDQLETIIHRHLRKGSVGEFALPGLLKIKTVKKPARKARKGVPNPFRPGELMDIAAKPASTRIKALPLKRLKDMV
jgi:nucleoid DNA-binding protein